MGTRNCVGDYILQLDADEYLPDSLLDSLKDIIEGNREVELFWFPRVNIIRNMTERKRDRGDAYIYIRFI